MLDDINLDVAEGEFVALLGRSGSGKSTLLRCIAGLIAPTEGRVLFRGERLTGSNRETTMVFQTFALLPWLTVQQNVELGLEARGWPPPSGPSARCAPSTSSAWTAYESAYPKELSGGMRQRVGFARALVVEPAALLMDEPFSALDVLTSENLRGELLELWEGQRFPTKTIVMVTHNIEEAVLLADRILVLGTNPGRIRTDMRNPLPRPRRRRTPEFDELVDEIYRMMTQRDAAPAAAPAAPAAPDRGRGTISDTPLPRATVDGLSGLAEVMLAARRQRRPGRPGRQPGPGGRRPAAAGRRAGHARLRRAASRTSSTCRPPGRCSPGPASRTARRSSPGPRWTARRWCGPSTGRCAAAWTARCRPGSSSTSCAPASASRSRAASSTPR